MNWLSYLWSHLQCDTVNGLRLKYPNLRLNPGIFNLQWSCFLQHLSVRGISPKSFLYSSTKSEYPHHIVPGTIRYSLSDLFVRTKFAENLLGVPNLSHFKSQRFYGIYKATWAHEMEKQLRIVNSRLIHNKYFGGAVNNNTKSGLTKVFKARNNDLFYSRFENVTTTTKNK